MKKKIAVKSPNHNKQTVIVVREDGSEEVTDVHRGGLNDCYLFLEEGRVYFDELDNGSWLENMLN